MSTRQKLVDICAYVRRRLGRTEHVRKHKRAYPR